MMVRLGQCVGLERPFWEIRIINRNHFILIYVCLAASMVCIFFMRQNNVTSHSVVGLEDE
jgi:hypothetical protein